MKGFGGNNKHSVFYCDASREPTKCFTEEGEQLDFGFCRDYSGYSMKRGEEGNKV
jgi:hypothetical protein